MNADDFRYNMLSFLFLRYLSGNYEIVAKKELGPDYRKLNRLTERLISDESIRPPRLLVVAS
jgi:hypothetical protein